MTSLLMAPISSFSTGFQGENLKPTSSDSATRQFPLTATTSILQDQFIPVPDSLQTSLKMEHYNSRGEIIHYPPSISYLWPYPYPFPLVYPSPPPLPSISLPDEIRRDGQCRGPNAAPSSTPIPPVPSSSRPTAPTTNPTTSAAINSPAPPIIGKKRPKPGPRCRIPPVSGPHSVPPLTLKWRNPRPLPIPNRSLPSNAPTADTATENSAIPAVTTTTTPKPCTTPSCAGIIPTGSSTLTRHCPSCVKADWNARKNGIMRCLQVARRVGHGGGQAETVERPGPQPGRSRSDSSASMSSLSSLSTLTSSDEDEDRDEERSIYTPATTIDGSQDSVPPLLLPAPMTTSKRPPPKLTLRFRSILYHSTKSFRYCCDPSCSRKLDKEYTRVRCVPCRARARQRTRELVEELTVLRRRRVDGGNTNETGGEMKEKETLDVIPGARLCVVRPCSHILPPVEEYKHNMCLGCRRFFSSIRGGNEAKESWNGFTAGDLVPGRKRCASLDCGVLVVESSGSGSLCVQCTKRKAWEMNRVERVRARRKTQDDASSTCTPCDKTSSVPPMYPEYHTLHSLSVHFRTLLYAFLRDQVSLALRQKSSPPTRTFDSVGPAPAPALFTFSGQFSTVSPTPDITHPTHKPNILRHISHVRTVLERSSRLRLQPQNQRDPLVAFKQGFAMRFACAHSIPLALFAPEGGVTADKDAEDAIRRNIKGELDIITVSDDSHSVVPGQMTVVRFRMGVVGVS
ncbi:hypothetical protein F5887DRAFT_983931 [Amanita rubescens]|nr:hypothetical protein F5887DRAFT_983931 [Amanita rubescens]